jgi:sortase B
VALHAIRLTGGIVDAAVLLAFGCYALWDSSQVRGEAAAERWERYRPASGDDGGGVGDGGAGGSGDTLRASFAGDSNSPSFAALRAVNPEVIAWLDLYGTGIDYPVAQGKDNMKYVNTDAKGSYSLAGSLFLDSDADAGFADFASVIYGHHMEGKALFGGLGLFAERAYFESHAYGRLYVDGRWHGLEAVAFVSTDAYDGEVYRAGITAPEDRRTYLDALLARALQVRDGSGLEAADGAAGSAVQAAAPGAPGDAASTVSVPGIGWTDGLADERLVLLSTCSPGATNARDILVCRLTDTVVPNPFAEPATTVAGTGAQGAVGGSDTLAAIASTWRGLPLWAKMATVAALAALVSVTLWACLHYGRRRRDRRAHAPRLMIMVLLALSGALAAFAFPAPVAYAAGPSEVHLTVAQQVMCKGAETDEGGFSYLLSARSPGAPLPKGASGTSWPFGITGTGEAAVGPIAFTSAGHYVYELRAVTDARPGYSYDTRRYTIEVFVDSGLGTVIAAYSEVGIKVPALAFTHGYEPPPPPPPDDLDDLDDPDRPDGPDGPDGPDNPDGPGGSGETDDPDNPDGPDGPQGAGSPGSGSGPAAGGADPAAPAGGEGSEDGPTGGSTGTEDDNSTAGSDAGAGGGGAQGGGGPGAGDGGTERTWNLLNLVYALAFALVGIIGVAFLLAARRKADPSDEGNGVG